MAVMERDDEEMSERVIITDQQDEVLTEKRQDTKREKTPEELQKEEELRNLKHNWASLFLNEGGIEFVVEQLVNVDLKNSENHTFVQLKNIAFFSSLAKVFITVAMGAENNLVTAGIDLLKTASGISVGDKDPINDQV